jgi:hypothetical protein
MSIVTIPQPQPFAIPATYGLPGTAGAPGAPGGNVLSIGLATAVAALSLGSGAPAGANLFHTEGYHSTADGGETWYRRMAAPEADEPGMLTSSDSVRLALLPKGAVSPEMFGAYGNDTTNDGAAFTAMENWRIAHRKGGTMYGYSYGSVGVKLNPSRAYYTGSTTWNIYTTAFINTPNGAGPSGLSSVIRPDPGVSGVIFHSTTSVGVSGEGTARAYSAVGSYARGLAVKSTFSGTEGETHGIQFRTKVVLAHPYAEGFAGAAIYADTSGADNINGFELWGPFTLGCRDGIDINYNNANAGLIVNPQCFAHRRWGIRKRNGIGGTIIGGDLSSNGLTVGFATQCSYLGNVFFCLPNQEVGAAANSPPATATNNTYWAYLRAGGAGGAIPAWSGGMSIRCGGAMLIDGSSEYMVVLGLYRELDQPSPFCNGKALFLGGVTTALAFDGSPYGGMISADGSGIYVPRSIFPVQTNFGGLGGPSLRWDNVYSVRFDATVGYYLNSALLIQAVATGWAADTGTAKRTANASYAPGSTLTFSAAYVQAEQTAMATRMAAVEAALRDATQTQKAIKDDFISHHQLLGT